MKLSLVESVLSTWPTVVTLFALFVVSQGWILTTLAETGQDLGRLQTICLIHPRNPGDAAREILRRWTVEDIANFQRHFLVDKLLHPVLYALFFCSAFLYDLFNRQPKQKLERQLLMGRITSAIIFFAGLCDILENSLHNQIQFEPVLHAPNDLLVGACVFASTKWAIMGVVSSWLIWRYVYAPTRVSILISQAKIDKAWNGPRCEDFANTQAEMGQLEVQRQKIPWTKTVPACWADENLSYTVSPHAHYIGYALDEIHIHIRNDPIRLFLAETIVVCVGYIFSLLRFDHAVYFNNYLLSTNMWPATIQWTPDQVRRVNHVQTC